MLCERTNILLINLADIHSICAKSEIIIQYVVLLLNTFKHSKILFYIQLKRIFSSSVNFPILELPQ